MKKLLIGLLVLGSFSTFAHMESQCDPDEGIIIIKNNIKYKVDSMGSRIYASPYYSTEGGDNHCNNVANQLTAAFHKNSTSSNLDAYAICKRGDNYSYAVYIGAKDVDEYLAINTKSLFPFNRSEEYICEDLAQALTKALHGNKE